MCPVFFSYYPLATHRGHEMLPSAGSGQGMMPAVLQLALGSSSSALLLNGKFSFESKTHQRHFQNISESVKSLLRGRRKLQCVIKKWKNWPVRNAALGGKGLAFKAGELVWKLVLLLLSYGAVWPWVHNLTPLFTHLYTYRMGWEHVRLSVVSLPVKHPIQWKHFFQHHGYQDKCKEVRG